MKIGIEALSWEPFLDLSELLATIQRLGYEGLEISHAPAFWGPPSSIRHLLSKFDLRLAGLGCGSLNSRLGLAKELRPDYIYFDEWDEESTLRALSAGYAIAFHPHLYKTIHTIDKAKSYLDQFPDVALLLDTAHSYLAGDNIIDTLKLYGNRVRAIYLRDWTGRYGRSPLRFARGFTGLGRGDLASSLKLIISYLLESNYTNWLIVGQDLSQGFLDCAEESFHWLREQGLLAG